MVRVSLALALLLSLCCCTTTKYVEVPVVTEKAVADSIYITRLKVDSIYQRDSIYINTYSRGDTVYRDKYKFTTRWRDRVRVDTLRQWHTDTIEITKTITLEVEKKLTWWQIVKQELGGFAMAVAVALLSLVAYLLYRKIMT